LSENETLFYIKRDGSLSNGLELVFHPRSLESWQETIPTVSKVVQKVIDEGASAFVTDTCGFHIHRSRTDLSRLDETKLCMLLKLWKTALEKVAQRKGSRYATWEVFDHSLTTPGTKPKNKIRLKSQAAKLVKQGYHTRERYQCINFRNRDTLEFRIYKGSLHLPTLQGYLGFTHYFVDFGKMLLVNEIDTNTGCKTCKKAKPNCATCQSDILWSRFLDHLDKVKKRPFAMETLDFLTKVKLGPEKWEPITKNWREI
jgi:hypothetical protein